MKSKFLKLLCIISLIALCSTEKSFALEVLQIGDGTTSNNTAYTQAGGCGNGVSNYGSMQWLFWNWNYANSHFAKVYYTPTEMAAAGGKPIKISSISFWIHSVYTNSSTANTLANASIWLRNVPAAEIGTTINTAGYATGGAIDTSAANEWQKVYYKSAGFSCCTEGIQQECGDPCGGGHYPAPAGYWFTFNFDTPFTYDGTSYLEVQFGKWGNSGTGNVNAFVVNYFTAAGGVYRYLSNSNGGATYSTRNTYEPHIRFNYEQPNMSYLRTEVSFPSKTRLTDKQYNVLQYNVITEKKSNPLKLNSLELNYNNTTASTKLSKIEVYSTGASDVFSTNNLVSSIINPDISELSTLNFNNQTLGEGNNYFWVVYEVDPTLTNCNNVLSGNVNKVIVGEDTYDINSSLSNTIPLQYDPISVPADVATEYEYCSNSASIDISFVIFGTVKNYSLYRQLTPSSTEFEATPLLVSSIPEFSIDSVYPSNGYTTYKIVINPPDGGCTAEQSYTVHMDSVTPVQSAKAYFNGEVLPLEDTLQVCENESLLFTSSIEGNYKGVRWEYYNNGYWSDISIYEMPTANTTTLEFIASERYKNTRIRLRADSESPCSLSEYSNEISIQVLKVPSFLQQPKTSIALCTGENFYVSVNFISDTPIFSCWYKDGYPLIDTNGTNIYSLQELNFENIDNSFAGKYYYISIVNKCGEIVTMSSDTVTLMILPETEVVNVTNGSVKGSIGGSASLQVAAHYAGITPDLYKDEFQWYRYDGILNQRIPLENSYKIKGANSSTLVISHIVEDDYTYNTDYYYCMVNGRCGGSATSQPIYLIPSDEIFIVEQPHDVIVCNDATETSLHIETYTSSTEPVKYRWYYGTQELSDDATYKGTATATLTIAIDAASTFSDKFYCKMWLGNDPDVNPVQSNEAGITVLNNYAITVVEMSPSTLDMEEGSELKLFITTANPDTDVISWYKDDNFTGVIGDEYIIPAVILSDSGTYSAKITNGCSELIPADMVVKIIPATPNTDGNGSIEEALLAEGIVLTPHPASNMLNVKFLSDTEGAGTIGIYDLRGTLLYECSITVEKGIAAHSIDLTNLNIINGSYFIRINNAGKYNMKPFIIAK